ncbi:hypothetical protein EVAR_20920_1 [Eumeta japonica]|uniref:Uncharacterized protein n=1 Tax=Eumeta variegata TaxID=151549 RepID=A0A4C1UWS2_EUMVA|nr:hypothetical protein EVAR_20920_1 [Eumeta japonica]
MRHWLKILENHAHTHTHIRTHARLHAGTDSRTHSCTHTEFSTNSPKIPTGICRFIQRMFLKIPLELLLASELIFYPIIVRTNPRKNVTNVRCKLRVSTLKKIIANWHLTGAASPNMAYPIEG